MPLLAIFLQKTIGFTIDVTPTNTWNWFSLAWCHVPHWTYVATMIQRVRAHNVTATFVRLWPPGGYEQNASQPALGILPARDISECSTLTGLGASGSLYVRPLAYRAPVLCVCNMPTTGEKTFLP